jgi:aspartate racemase
MKRVGLFGTRFTMQASFYPDVFEPAGISLIVPSIGEQDYIHAKYMGELVDGIVLPWMASSYRRRDGTSSPSSNA